MVWMALTLVTLTAFAGLGLEYGRWNNLSTRIQKAADAAALAGAIFMPENVGNKAFNDREDHRVLQRVHRRHRRCDHRHCCGQAAEPVEGHDLGADQEPMGSAGRLQLHARSFAARWPSTNSHRTSGARPTRTGTTPSRPGAAAVLGKPLRAVVEQGQGRRDPVGRADGERDAVRRRQLRRAAVNKDYDVNGYFYGIDVPAGASRRVERRHLRPRVRPCR